MKNINITYGSNMHEVFLIPTMRIERYCEMRYLTIEWLKWYVGICWSVED